MTTGGWVIMVVSVGFVTGLFSWCIYKVLTTPGSGDRVRGPVNIRPGDLDPSK